MKNYKDYITQNPNVRGGKPCLRDTGIAISDIKIFLASQTTEIDILEEFSELTKENIKAAKAYLKAK